MGALTSILAIAAANPASATDWGAPIRVTDSGLGYASMGALAATGTTGAVMVIEDPFSNVVVRRSTDSGLTWAAPVQVSTPGKQAWRATLGASGRAVDVIWTEGVDCHAVCPLFYRRSLNGGATFRPAKRLSPAGSLILNGQVARRGDTVAVVWTDAGSDDVYVRVSRDGGATFGVPRILDHTTNTPRPIWDQGKDANVTVAIGNGVIHVAYYPVSGRLFVRRSTDGGATWKPRVRLATGVYSYDAPAIAAAGTDVIVAYPHGADPAWVVARRSVDKGATWKPEVTVSSRAAPSASGPIVAMKGDTVAIVFDRCSTEACPVTQIVARVSTNGGATWGAASVVDVGTPERTLAIPFGIAVGAHVVVGYWIDDPEVDDLSDVWASTSG